MFNNVCSVFSLLVCTFVLSTQSLLHLMSHSNQYWSVRLNTHTHTHTHTRINVAPKHFQTQLHAHNFTDHITFVQTLLSQGRIGGEDSISSWVHRENLQSHLVWSEPLREILRSSRRSTEVENSAMSFWNNRISPRIHRVCYPRERGRKEAEKQWAWQRESPIRSEHVGLLILKWPQRRDRDHHQIWQTVWI